MKKKALSLALALVMCLGLMSVPSFAAGIGDTTVEDSAGYRYTLSQPVEAVSETTVGDAHGEYIAPVYQIPVGTTITPVCPEGEKGEDAGGIFYALTDEEGIRQAGDAVQNGDSSQATFFTVSYTIMAKINGKATVLGDLEGEADDFGNPLQPLPEGKYLISRNISWAYSSIDDGVSGSSTSSVGKSSYFSVEIVPESAKPTTPVEPEKPAEVKTANPTNDKLEVNGAEKAPTVYKIGGSNYFKIRDVAAVLNGTEKQFAVGYSGGKVTVTSGQPYEATGKELAGAPEAAKEASSSNDAIVIDGVETSLTVYKIGGSNYFKLRDLGESLNFYVGWEAGRGVYIETDKPYSK